MVERLAALEGVREVTPVGDRLWIRCQKGIQGHIARAVMDAEVELLELCRRSYTLEDIFLIVWPQLVGLIALASICFAVSYIILMRREIRSP